MKQLTGRQKIGGGVFLIVGAAWTLDTLTGGPTPAPAKGATAQQVVTGTEFATPQDPPDLEQVMRKLSATTAATRAPLPLEHLHRDPFEITEAFVVAPSTLAGTDDGGKPKAAAAPTGPPAFAEQHRLEGITSGRVPLALIDGRLYRVGAVIDDYRLTEIGADFVVFACATETVSLRLEQGGLD